MSFPFFEPNMGLLASILWGVAVGVIFWYVGKTAVTVTYVTLADGRRTVRTLPLAFRLLLPWTHNIAWVNRSRYDKARKVTHQKLVTAAFDDIITPNEFMSLKFLMPMVMGPILCGFLYLAFSKIPGKAGAMLLERKWIIFFLIILLCYVHPGSWLKGVIKRRHRAIERALPFVLDLLTLSVEAGLDFMSGIKRILERRKIDPLGEELVRLFREMQVGKTRKEALRALAERTDHTDVRSVVNALTQADELGVSIGTILRIQADQIRQRRFQRAEEMANKAPVKLLFPLVCFIFPAVFLVLLGPIFLQMFQGGGF